MPAQSPRVFPDQGAKLRYLIWIRGDRRPLIAGPAGARSPRRTRDRFGDLTPPIGNQEGLAAALGVDKSRVSDWSLGKARIPDGELVEICAIYAVGERAFRTWTYDEFEMACVDEDFETRPVTRAAASSRWRSLLRERGLNGVRLLLADPHGDPFAPTAEPDLRHARVGAAAAGPPLPEVSSETPFWLALASPQTEDGVPAWAGWHLLLLDHDRQTDGFACPLAHGAARSEAVMLRFPDARTLYLPPRMGLQHPASDRGTFAMIAVLSQRPFPVGIVQALAVAEAHGPELEPALSELVVWIDKRPDTEATAIVSLAYRVVASTDAGDR